MICMSGQTGWLNEINQQGCISIDVNLSVVHFHDVHVVLVNNALVSEKNGTFICELIMERYAYLCNLQEQQNMVETKVS